jgi:uroporphyrinogen-III decarboxylase
MAPQRFLDDPPPRVHRALVALTESVVRIGRAALAAGADGVYLSVWGTDVLPEAAFREYGRPYDLAVVDALRQGTFTILHVHGGQGLNLTWVADYPVTVVSWSTWASGISLEEGVHLLPGKVPMGGVAEGGPAVDEGGGAELTRQAEAALQWAQEQGRPLLLAPGCSLPDAVSDTVLDRLRKAVDRPAP